MKHGSDDTRVKSCLYCCHEYEGRGRCCCKDCAKRINGKAAWVTRSRNIAIDRIMAAAQRKARHVSRFRQLSMGDLQPDIIHEIFGTLPTDDTPRHGDNITF